MDVTSATSTVPTTQASADGQDASVISSDFETFLKMLTAQLENQDPLNPLDSQDFAVQLATFSNVEQQVQTNDLLRNLTENFEGSDLGAVGGLIGQNVRAAAPALFEGKPIEIETTFAANTNTASLIVRDLDGQVVERRQLNIDQDSYTWDGLTEEGQFYPNQIYRFSIESREGEEVISESPAATYSEVVEARLENGLTTLVLPGGIIVSQDQVTAIRN